MIADQISKFRNSITDLRREYAREQVIRRYQKWTQGEPALEDRVTDLYIKMRVYVITSWRNLVKRSFDMGCAILGLISLLPVMGVITIAIRCTSRGPAIYKQARVGYRGRIFDMYKFRTMIHNAETKTGPVWASKNDSRITSLGLFLRKTHLDELPQLLNVLKGEMSIVGPRPERPYFVSEFRKTIPQYEHRLCAKPGITGLAQIKRRYDETIADVKKKLRYDLLYVQKMCPLLDFKVMAMTIGAILLKTGR